VVRAVDGVSLALEPGRTLAVVGESGSGKSVTALSVLRLIATPPGRIVGGSIRFRGRDLLSLSEPEMRGIRGREISMIFQEPMTSLNRSTPAGRRSRRCWSFHHQAGPRRGEATGGRAAEEGRHPLARTARGRVPAPDVGRHAPAGDDRDGACLPAALLIADEPTTALDVTIQAQILELLRSLQRELEMSVLLITHDLGVVAETAEHVAVMYAGQVVETCGVREIFRATRHPYTAGLLASLPRLGDEVAAPAAGPRGCG
jgi:ABC-type dipeptide/oligopeptide/nickel transport system ATPase component